MLNIIREEVAPLIAGEKAQGEVALALRNFVNTQLS